jgi:hypothetical protein
VRNATALLSQFTVTVADDDDGSGLSSATLHSRPVDSILREVEALSEQGVKEITLLGNKTASGSHTMACCLHLLSWAANHWRRRRFQTLVPWCSWPTGVLLHPATRNCPASYC